MKKYIEIYNNEIVQIHESLPQCWNNISNFHILSDNELQDLSWSGNSGFKFYKFIENPKPEKVKLYDIFGPNYIIDDENKIVQTEWKLEKKSPEVAWNIIRTDRNKKLSNLDWTQILDSPLNEQKRAEFKIYRQNLRDITNQKDPFNITWPIEPTF